MIVLSGSGRLSPIGSWSRLACGGFLVVLLVLAHSALGSLDLGDQSALKGIAAHWTILQTGTNPWSASNAQTACTAPWRGVVCSTAAGTDRVTAITLPDAGLEANLPKELFELSALLSLDLSKNPLNGSMDPFFGTVSWDALQNLTSLNLSQCGFEGNVSDSLGLLDKLAHLHLDVNSFSGVLPPSLQNLTNLVTLNVSANAHLGGQLLGWFGSFPNLEVFSATLSSKLSPALYPPSSTNPISYLVSPEISSCQRLRILELEDTVLSGVSMPTTVGDLVNLEVLKVTQLMAFPNVTHLTSLKYLRFTFSQLLFTDPLTPPYLPSTLGGMVGLEVLDMGSHFDAGSIPNEAQETLPQSIGMLTNLVRLDISFLGLVGSLPSSVSSLTQLRELRLQSNSFNGTLQLDSWPLLDTLDASYNQFTQLTASSTPVRLSLALLTKNRFVGPIPEHIFAPNLVTLFLDDNFFNDFPSTASSLSPQLQTLQLAANELTTIPDSIGSFPNLSSLVLAGNNLSSMGFNNTFFNNYTGSGNQPVPTGRHARVWDIVAQLPLLRMLVVTGCQLQGTIPESIGSMTTLTELHANTNDLDGNPFPVSARLGWRANLLRLDLLKNSLSGTLPDWIGEMQSLSSLGLSTNQLSGTIPTSLGQLPLIHLDLGSNRLSGTIPYNLGQSPYIQSIDLSHNDLNGSLPMSFNSDSNSTFSPWLSTLDVSFNRLTFCPSNIQELPYWIAVQGSCDLSNQKDDWSRPYDCGCAAGVNAFSNCTVSYPLTQCIPCSGPPPAESNPPFECRGGQWVLSGPPEHASLTNTSLTVSGSPVVIPGNFSAGNITFQGLGSGTLTIGGCASNLTGITLILTPADLQKLQSLPKDLRNKKLLSSLGCDLTDDVPISLVLPTSTCMQVSAQTAKSSFESIAQAYSEFVDGTLPKKIKSPPKFPLQWGVGFQNDGSGSTNLSVLFNVNNSRCNRVKWWVILLAVVLAVALIAAAAGLTWYFVKRGKNRQTLTAFRRPSSASASPVVSKSAEN